MMRARTDYIKKFWWAGWLVLVPLISGGQNIQSEAVFVDPAFTYDHWTVEDGLPVNSINQILQSGKGYIWIGTYDGLVRFDGIRFKVYKSSEYPGLPGNRIINLAETPDGTLWLRTEQEKLVRFREDTFRTVTTKDGLLNNRIHCFFKDENGRLWIGTESGITIYENNELRPYHPEIIDERINLIYVDENGVLWYKSDTTFSLYRFDGTQKKAIAHFRETNYPTPFLTLSDGSTIFVTKGHVYQFNKGTIVQWPNLPPDLTIIDLFENPDGSVMGTTLKHGIVKLSGKRMEQINPGYRGRLMPGFGGRMGETLFTSGENTWAVGDQSVLFNYKRVFSFPNQITDFVYDTEGGFWFGTSNAGLFRLKPNLFKTYSVNDKAVYPVIESKDGSIWFGYDKKIGRLKNDKLYTDFQSEQNLDAAFVSSILERKNGDLIAGLGQGGISKLSRDGKTFIPFSIPVAPDEKKLSAYALFEDRDGRLWMGTNKGVFLKTRNNWEKFDLMTSGYVRYFTQAPDGSIWMGSYGGGIFRYNSEKFKNYTLTAGLASNLIRTIYVDTTSDRNNYVLWIGSEDKGLNRLSVKNGVPDFSGIVHYDENVGLYDNVVHQILVDEHDRFWMSGNKGISWVNRAELERFANGKSSKIYVTSYTERDGLRNREANGGVQSAGIISSNGNIWFPTQDGLVMVNPDNITQNGIPPPVVIEQIRSKEKLIMKQEGQVILQPDQRDIEIAYTGLSFMVPEKVRFRYRLNGFNDNWIEAGTRRTAFYTNVPTGNYEFEVLAANNEGIWSPEPTTLTIEILPFFYETTTFYVALFVLAGLMVAGFVHMRTARLKKREAELEQSVQERTRELEKEKEKTEAQARELRKLDEMKNQLFTNISHEFRTPLTLIISPLKKLLKNNSNLIADKAVPEVNRVLRNSQRLRRLIDQILDLSKLEVGELKLQVTEMELVDFMSTMVDLFKPLSKEQDQMLEFKTDIAELLLYADSDAMEKILANLLSNAIKFTPPGGNITVELLETDDECQIKVRDSGIGIPEEKQRYIFDRFYQVDASSTRVAEGTGIGLALVKNLVELHHGSITVDSVEGEGTEFTVILKKGKEHFNESDIDPVVEGDFSIDRDAKVYSGYGFDFDENEAVQDPDRPTVLVVEDNSDMRAFVASVLSDNFSVIKAADGEVALDLIKENLPDLIVADIMMPKMDGMKLNGELKKDPMLETIPVIFLTAKTEQDSKLEGFRKGADDYLTKPFDSELLIARVENIIKKRQRLRERILQEGIDSREKIRNAPEPNKLISFLGQVREVLERRFADPDFSVQELSQELHMDRTQLYRKLKEETDKSPQQFISDFRMQKAGQMLEEKVGNISEVAYATGFNTLSYFNKVFKQYYEVNPSEYQSNE